MKHFSLRPNWFRSMAALALPLGLCFGAASAHAGKTLDAIKQRGSLNCGVATGVAGFAAADSKGEWSGLDVDTCRAIGAAVLGDAKKVNFVPLTSQQRFASLQAGEVDVLARNTTWTMNRDTALGFHFTAINYFDGQGFLIPKKLKITSAKQLKNAEICVQTGTTNEKNLADYFRVNNIPYKTVVFDNFEASYKAFFAGRCQAYTTDASGLAGLLNKEAKNPDDYVILPDLISKEPFAPLVRRGDDEWFSIVKWVVYALVEAEENNITQANVDQLKADSKEPVVQRLLGTSEDTGKWVGLDREWAARAIKAVGNYGEVFDRNVGPNSAIKLPRGLNKLWSQGGLMYAPPVR
jgi:general L-amino acid transport system substrate-binding protein